MNPTVRNILTTYIPWLRDKAERLDDVVESIDVAPTLLALARVPAPESFVGRALITLEGASTGPGRSLTRHVHSPSSVEQRKSLGFSERSYRPHVSLRASNFKLVLMDSGRLGLFEIGGDTRTESPLTLSALPDLLNGSGEKSEARSSDEYREERERALRALGYID